jgi:hypothetical protein
VVLVDQAAETITTTHIAVVAGLGRRRLRYCQLEAPVVSARVVMRRELLNDSLQVSSAEDEGPVQALGPERAHPSLQKALAFGARIGVRTMLMPSDRSTSSKGPENLLSRSWIRNVGERPSSRAMARFRACWIAQAESGFDVTPPRWTL